MAKCNKPIIWLPFAAGGMIAALIYPALFVVTAILMPLGLATISYETAHAFAANILGKIVLLGILFPTLWHAAHRFRITLQDFGARTPGPRAVVAAVCYGFGAVFSVLLIAALLTIW